MAQSAGAGPAAGRAIKGSEASGGPLRRDSGTTRAARASGAKGIAPITTG